ncbi:S41 family peptidase [Pseudoteredinibacter isoporae]|uniref:S41 family peptidase n=1 Tax=Pseudoteredinibacter isoporae TaxID=570281 RepID=UPI003105241E
MNRSDFKLWISLFTLLAVCLSVNVHSQAEPLYEGFWETEGYGYIFGIQKKTVTIYEKTAISCLVSGLSSGKLNNTEPQAAPYFHVAIPGFINARMEIYQRSDSSNDLVFHRTDTNTWMVAKRVSSLPEQCSATPNPALALEVFVQNFREHYPFLLRNPAFIGEVNSDHKKFTGQPLFDEIKSLLRKLEDPHTALFAPDIDQLFLGNELPKPQVPTASELATIKRRVEAHYVVGNVETLNEQMRLGQLPDGLSYLAVDGFWGLSKEGTANAERLAMEAALPKILKALKSSKGLVIDLRAHSGGSDKLGIQLAGIFTKKDYLAYRKQFVIEGGVDPKWQEGMPIMVRSIGGSSWAGQIAILTSPATVSAGEAFVMALEQRYPRVKRVGEKTRGSFSDMLPRTLPNGWLFSLPNERYLDAAGKSFDFIGIEPHLYVEDVLGESENSRRDRVLEAAMDFLLQSPSNH